MNDQISKVYSAFKERIGKGLPSVEMQAAREALGALELAGLGEPVSSDIAALVNNPHLFKAIASMGPKDGSLFGHVIDMALKMGVKPGLEAFALPKGRSLMDESGQIRPHLIKVALDKGLDFKVLPNTVNGLFLESGAWKTEDGMEVFKSLLKTEALTNEGKDEVARSVENIITGCCGTYNCSCERNPINPKQIKDLIEAIDGAGLQISAEAVAKVKERFNEVQAIAVEIRAADARYMQIRSNIERFADAEKSLEALETLKSDLPEGETQRLTAIFIERRGNKSVAEIIDGGVSHADWQFGAKIKEGFARDSMVYGHCVQVYRPAIFLDSEAMGKLIQQADPSSVACFRRVDVVLANVEAATEALEKLQAAGKIKQATPTIGASDVEQVQPTLQQARP